MNVKSSIAKLSPAQMKKLHQGKSVRVQYGNAHEIALPAKEHKKLMKAHSMGKGIVLNGGSLFSDMKKRYEEAIPAKYRAPIEGLVTMGLQDAGVIEGGSLFSDMKKRYEETIPAKYRAPIEGLVTMGLQDAGVIEGSGGRGRGLVPNIQQLVDAQNQLAVYNPVKPMSGKGKRLVQKTLRGKGWKEDLEAFNAWTGSIGDKLLNVGRTIDPEGKLQKALINRATDEIDPSAKTARIASQTIGNLVGKPASSEETTNYAPAEMLTKYAFNQIKSKESNKKKKKKIPVVTAEIVDEETPVAQRATARQMASLLPIPASFKYVDQNEGRAYQPARFMGTGKKPHMVKGSQSARDHMAKLRAMRGKKMSGTALYPAGYSR